MRFHPSMLCLFTPVELERIVMKSSRTAVDDNGLVTQILLLTDHLDADIYVSSRPGSPVLIYSFDEGPIMRERFLDRLKGCGALSPLDVWHA